MFIEGVRRAKNKWRIGVAVLLGLIIVSLVLSFAFFGSSIGGVSESTTPTDILESAELTAETAAEAAADADGDMTVQGQAAAAYLSLAAYRELYLEDPSDAFAEALVYAQNMVAACGSAENPEYTTAYGYVLAANEGLGDAAALSAAFIESLDYVELDEGYINSYYQSMNSLDAVDQFVTDMDAVKAILEPQVEEVAEEDAEAEDGEEGEEHSHEEGSPAAVLEYVDELIVSANVQTATAE